MMKRPLCGTLILLLMGASLPASAYVGPGAGLSLIGSLIGVLGVIVVAGFGVLLYPLQQLRDRLRRRKCADDSSDTGAGDSLEADTKPDSGPG